MTESPALPSAPSSPCADRIKIWFRFVPREGWLPQDTEGMWAEPVGTDTARVVNVPFLQDGVAEGDVVRYRTDEEGLHWATGRVAASGNVTVRVLPVRSGPLGPSARAVHERLRPFGLGGESFSEEFPLVALTVPVDAPMAEIKALLDRGTADGWWHWETGCGTDAWHAA
ncbi:DUF4265 domain-containing protein [Streptomyces sp. NPDC101160]|uniref:DUF4265 domain-containing protein n=1 Tax=Streptomyces sp. NPDC101160 TaxID=3366118 RepID=UPI0037FCEC45